MIRLLIWLCYPLTLFIFGLSLAFVFLLVRRIKLATWVCGLSMVWLFFWGTDVVPSRIGVSLEVAYPPLTLEQTPRADTIILLGGGMGQPQGICLYPELFGAADRVWHAARLYHAGKAPTIIASGCAEKGSSAVLLRDLGIPADAIIIEGKARNTVENGVYTRDVIRENGYTNALLVTSAYHMRRSEMIFTSLGLQVIPVATDHESMYGNQKGPLSLIDRLGRVIPRAGTLERSACYLKEWVGYWGDMWRVRKYKGL